MKDNLEKKFASARALYPHTKKVTYLNSAAYGPYAQTLADATADGVRQRLEATNDDTHQSFGLADGLRKDFAGLIGATKKEVGLAFNTTYGLNLAAYGLPLKRGDEILLSDVEFPAAVYTFRGAAEARGLKLRLIKSRDMRFDIDEFRKAIRPRSRVLCISFVQFFNGYKNDLATIGEICRKHKMFFVVDGIQGMGVEPINVRSLGIDIFASGCQKWMLGPHGTGFFYLSDNVRDRMSHPFMTWLGVDWGMNFGDLLHFDRPYFDSARRFETGNYPALNIWSLKEAVKIFQSLGIRNIQKHNHDLIDRLVGYIRTNPFYRVTSSLEPKHRSSMLTFSCKDVTPLHRRLLDHKIILVRREGSIRVSVHLFNNQKDVDRLIQVLDDYAKEHR